MRDVVLELAQSEDAPKEALEIAKALTGKTVTIDANVFYVLFSLSQPILEGAGGPPTEFGITLLEHSVNALSQAGLMPEYTDRWTPAKTH